MPPVACLTPSDDSDLEPVLDAAEYSYGWLAELLMEGQLLRTTLLQISKCDKEYLKIGIKQFFRIKPHHRLTLQWNSPIGQV